MLNPTDLDSVRDALQQIADENYPGHRGAEFHIRTALGPVIVAAVPYRRPPPPPRRYEPDVESLSDSEQEIVLVLTEAGTEPLKGEEIAKKIGCEYSGPLRSTLASLVRRGVIVRAGNRPGYQIHQLSS